MFYLPLQLVVDLLVLQNLSEKGVDVGVQEGVFSVQRLVFVFEGVSLEHGFVVLVFNPTQGIFTLLESLGELLILVDTKFEFLTGIPEILLIFETLLFKSIGPLPQRLDLLVQLVQLLVGTVDHLVPAAHLLDELNERLTTLEWSF